MKVKWLLQEDVFKEDLGPFIKELDNQGFEHKTVKYVPFEGSQQFLNAYAANDCVLFYGSLQMARQVLKQSAWTPGAFCDLPKFECTYYYPRIGHYLLNNQYTMLPYGDLKRNKQFLIDTLGEDGCVFVRPNSGFKIFSGQIIDSRNWDKNIDNLGYYNVKLEDLAIVAKPKPIEREWRLVIVDQKVVADGQYIENNTLIKVNDSPLEVTNFANTVLKNCNYVPERAWCLDICESDGYLYVLEVGCFSSAGFYGIDPTPIIQEASKAALEEWTDIQ